MRDHRSPVEGMRKCRSMFDMMATVITIPLQVKGVVSFAALNQEPVC